MPTNQATIQTHPTGSWVLFTFNKLTFEKNCHMHLYVLFLLIHSARDLYHSCWFFLKIPIMI